MRIARTVRSDPNGDPDFSPLRPTPREYAVTPTTRTSNTFQPSLKKQVPNVNKRNSNSAEKMQVKMMSMLWKSSWVAFSREFHSASMQLRTKFAAMVMPMIHRKSPCANIACNAFCIRRMSDILRCSMRFAARIVQAIVLTHSSRLSVPSDAYKWYVRPCLTLKPRTSS